MRGATAALKILASSAFVVVALGCGAMASTYGRLVLLALALSWVGDLLLLSARTAPFLGGLAAFLAAHVAYAAAFASRPLSSRWLLAGAALMAIVGAITLRWLWTHLDTAYRVAVTAYVLALGAMVSLAIGAAAGWGLPLLAVGALAFAASDISVARDRFVAPGLLNRLWGLPLYYAAQLLIACSVARAT
jgi:uncharacterized membrane protein YhhN